ncbi:hypothetical protein D9611_007124 [Ephemerocybe angulata]|uniref:Uncharacterized protein n=1 Tax=Ephemerocybe angulata TaxID=980116 RepID=A0A8H5B169_9AGAR|nr:hypothetical protein D9611_007124 [Tulosesus angulatus]
MPENTVDFSIVHAVPGLDKPVDYVPTENDPLYAGRPLPTALLQNSSNANESFLKVLLPLLTVREILMLQFMEQVTDKPEWQKKVFDETIVEKWRAETASGFDFSKDMFEFCIAELRYKAENVYQDPNTPITVYNGDVVKSDSAVPDTVKIALQLAVKSLEHVPDNEKDWHPDSNNMVLDLVHPSLFPLVYGKSRVLKVSEKVVGLTDCVTRCGEGEVLEVKEDENAKANQYRRSISEPYSLKYQWLPSEVDISGPESRIISYINNLHPEQTELYSLVEKVIDAAIPLWERTLAALYKGELDFVKRVPCYDAEYKDPEEAGDTQGQNQGRDDDDEDEDEDEDEPRHIVIQPEPQPFAPEICQPTLPLSFKELYGAHARPLQIIVKLANIELTPEKPRYEGGTWHVEGKQNEHICATALYYYSNDNIKASHLAFRQFVDSYSITDFNYDHNHFEFLEDLFGCQNDTGGAQDVGKVETKEGRLLTFPNILQHQVQPFELEDPTRRGHRKILALFLVDPNVRVISTAHVPCQQLHWWRDATTANDGLSEGPAKGLDKLPVELRDQVFEGVEGFPISLSEAKEMRKELMEERKNFVADQAYLLEQNNGFSLCEH